MDVDGRTDLTARSRGVSIALVACILAGTIAGYFLLGEEWAAWRRVLGGAFAGLGIGILIFASRWIG
jgi:Flp pilus assembly protein protease CpaA